MTDIPETGCYQSRLGEEQYLRFCPQSNFQVFFIEAFFEERNFLRRTVTEIARALARNGIGSVLPNLPGTGDSPIDLAEISLADWRDAVTDASRWTADITGRPAHIAALRGGVLLDDAAVGASWWRFAPATGTDILRPMRRVAGLTGEEGMLAGYPISPEMLAEMGQAAPQVIEGPFHECRVQTEGVPLWRRAEPGEDRDLVIAIANDIARWVRSCA